MRFETLTVHAGYEPGMGEGDLAPPIRLATTFARDEAGTPLGGHTYIRESNPTQGLLENALAALEGGEGALVFGSGMAAGAALLQAFPAGSHVIFPDDAYYGYGIAGREFLPRWGMSASFVAMQDLAELERAMRPETRLVWMESPSNPLMKIVDIAGAAGIARRAGALSVVDGTFPTPALQQSLKLGADVVLHATTKYLGGHSDVQGGALVFAKRNELFEATAHIRHVLGAVASPFGSWLVLRGVKTLACRVRAQSETALALARALEGHRGLTAVHYPGLPSHPGHDVAKRQMSAFGAMMSLRVAGGREKAIEVAGRVKIFTRATSLGGVESLIEHRQTSEGAGSTAPPELLRVSVGLEHADDLIEDLSRALA